MEHGDHSTPAAKRFGDNTNGFGIALVAIVAICLALFCWNFWKDGSKEIDHYRLNTLSATPHNDDHEGGEKSEVAPAAEASDTDAPSAEIKAQQADTMSNKITADSAKVPAAH